MKAKLEFDLDKVEDEEKFRVCSKGVDWYLVCFNLEEKMRQMIEYKNASDDVAMVRKKLYELMEKHKVSLEDMS